jgi:hypothetical protein
MVRLTVRQCLRPYVQGLISLGIEHNSMDSSADVAVIWSQLWHGRMKHNQGVWETFRRNGRPVDSGRGGYATSWQYLETRAQRNW